MGTRGYRGEALGVFALVLGALLVQKFLALQSWNWSLFDTRIYLDASRHAMQGSGDLYTGRFGDGWPFTYPPFAVLVFAPWALTSWAAATAELTLLSILALARISWLVARRYVADLRDRRELSIDPRWTVPLLAAFILALSGASDAVNGTIAFGQINLVMAWLVVEDYLGARRGRGWLVGLAAGIKVTPALAAVPRFFAGDARAALTSIATAAASVALAAMVLPHESVEYFTGALWDTTRPGSPESEWNQSIAGMCARLLHGSPLEGVVRWALVALALAAGVFVSSRLLRRGDALGAVLGVFVTTGSASPISWYHHLVMLPIFCLWALAPSRAWPRRFAAAIGVQAVIIGIWVMVGVYQNVPRDNGAELHHDLMQMIESEALPLVSLTIILTLVAAVWPRRVEAHVNGVVARR